MTYTYKNAIDVINGGYVDAYTDANFNAMLKAGNFYEVYNGYVVKKIGSTAEELAAYGIKSGLLLFADSKAKYTANYSYQLLKNYDPETTDLNEDTAVIEYNAPVTTYSSVLPKLYMMNGFKYVNAYGITETLASNTDLLTTASGTATTEAKSYVDAAATLATIAAKKFVDKINDTNSVTNDATTDSAVEVYYYDGTGSLAVANKLNAAPILIAKNTTILETKADNAIPASVTIVAFDEDGQLDQAEALFINGTDKPVITAGETTVKLVPNKNPKNVLYAKNVATADAQNGATIVITGTKAATDKIVGFNYIDTQIDGKDTIKAIDSANVTKSYYYVGTVQYGEITVQLDSDMIVNLQETEELTDEFLASAVIKLVLSVKKN